VYLIIEISRGTTRTRHFITTHETVSSQDWRSQHLSLAHTREEKGHIESETDRHIILLLISAPVIDKIFTSVKVDKNITPRRLYEILKFSMRNDRV
jgi:hypothetical protein